MSAIYFSRAANISILVIFFFASFQKHFQIKPGFYSTKYGSSKSSPLVRIYFLVRQCLMNYSIYAIMYFSNVTIFRLEQGRVNKLVDGCYSFWQGGAFPILHSVLQMYGDENLSQHEWMFDQRKP